MYIDDMLIMAQSETTLRNSLSRRESRICDQFPQVISGASEEHRLSGGSRSILHPWNSSFRERRSTISEGVGGRTSYGLDIIQGLGKDECSHQIAKLLPWPPSSVDNCRQTCSRPCTRQIRIPFQLSSMVREEFEWWITHFTNWNGRSLLTKKHNVTVETDASLMGWGAVCRGTRRGGPWSWEEQNLHINCLEMLAAFLAFKCFFREKRSIHVLLRMDNTSAIAYINKMGGTVSPTLNILNKEIWLWCMERDIAVQAQHLAGALNYTASVVVASGSGLQLIKEGSWVVSLEAKRFTSSGPIRG